MPPTIAAGPSRRLHGHRPVALPDSQHSAPFGWCVLTAGQKDERHGKELDETLSALQSGRVGNGLAQRDEFRCDGTSYKFLQVQRTFDAWRQTMRVLVSEFMSLDGVVQAPGGPEEDTTGGFRHGGWSMPYFDPEVMGAVVDEFAERNEVLLQGRRTYQVSAAAWPERGGDPFSDWINQAQKYVVSDTLTDGDLSWQPTTIIRGADLLSTVAGLRDKPGADIYMYGSLSVVRSLLTAGLVDELVLMIEPITLGGGKTLFPADGEARRFRLISAKTAATGVQVCRYEPDRA
jgi:dihydrofolate reductase